MKEWMAVAAIAVVASTLGFGGLAGGRTAHGGEARKAVAVATRSTSPAADIAAEVDRRLAEAPFSTVTTPSDAPSAISRDGVLRIIKRDYSALLGQAESVDVRHVTYTNRNIAKLSVADRRKVGYDEAPVGLDAWMITFHGVTMHGHGPRGSDHSPKGDEVVVLSSRTGACVEVSGFTTGL